MKSYISGSIKGGREKEKEYYELIEFIKQYGEVLTEHIGNDITDINNEIKYSTKEDEHVYIRDTKWIDMCDVLIAEVSIPSLGVGYEIAYAESKGKHVICLYNIDSEKSLSYMISGNIKNKVIIYKTLDKVKKEVSELLFNKKCENM